jgi:hypothetical protein
VSAAGERLAQAAAGTGVLRCSVVVPVPFGSPPPVLIPCPRLADGFWQGRCPCGHVRDGWLCGVHAAMAGDGGCRACLELAEGPHDCPLPVSRITPEKAS